LSRRASASTGFNRLVPLSAFLDGPKLESFGKTESKWRHEIHFVLISSAEMKQAHTLL
jgi:hypothetical protein